MWKIKLFLLLQFVNYCKLQEFGELADLHVGCYRDNPESRDLDKRLSGDLNSIDKCIEACTDNYYRYAGTTFKKLSVFENLQRFSRQKNNFKWLV